MMLIWSKISRYFEPGTVPVTISDLDLDLAAKAEPAEARRERRFEEIADRYTYHPPTDEQVKIYTSLRTRVKELAFLIEEVCPDSEEKAAAFASLDLTLMNANASIARHS